LLVDSNILVYTFDPGDQAKRARAVEVVDRLFQSRRGVLSVQCLTEFYNTITKRLPAPVPEPRALRELEWFTQSWRVLDLTESAVLEGCRISAQHSLSVWDSLIWAVAKLNQVPVVLTEDMQDGQFLEGVTFRNPLLLEFDLADLD
jgi:predicted nucleic acid-binding protein